MGQYNTPKPTIEMIYTRYADMLFRLAYTHLSSQSDAEDAVSDVFVRYMQNAPDFQDQEHEKAWFVRVLINRCNDLYRKKTVRAYTPLEEVTHVEHVDGESSEVLTAVQQLPEKYRTAVLLHYFEGFSVNEIAKIQNTSAASVKMRLMRSRNLLKAHLEGAE